MPDRQGTARGPVLRRGAIFGGLTQSRELRCNPGAVFRTARGPILRYQLISRGHATCRWYPRYSQNRLPPRQSAKRVVKRSSRVVRMPSGV